MKRKVGVLGATGSVGRQCMQVLAQHPERWEVCLLSGYTNQTLLANYADAHPHARICGRENAEELADPATYEGLDVVVNAIGGLAGLRPTFAVLESGATLATANKESLVAAGDLFRAKVKEKGATVIPVDSEHSALMRCMQGETGVRCLYLTASGGPFRDWPRAAIAAATPADALQHPTWKMGRKVTLDCATLMNKGFEVLEAGTLFGPLPVRVVMHRESVVHALVELEDGMLKAVLSAPDMQDPIRYALGYPEIVQAESHTNLFDYSTLHFEPVDEARFPALKLCLSLVGKDDGARSVLVSANDAALQLFLAGKIGFYGVTDCVSDALEHFRGIPAPGTIDEILRMDEEVKEYTLTKAGMGGNK